jgi:hypothetical protein
VRQLDFLPSHFVTVAREYQNVEEVRVPDRIRSDDYAAFIVDPKGCRVNLFSMPNDLCRIRVIGYAAAEK